VKAQEALLHCQSYLDGQLDAATRVELEAFLAEHAEVRRAFDAQRQYFTFLKRSCAHAPASNDACARLTRHIANLAKPVEAAASRRGTAVVPIGRPDLETARAPIYRSKRTLPVRSLALAASVFLVVGALVVYQSACLTGRCAYIQAAAAEFQHLERNIGNLRVNGEDPARLTRYVGEQIHVELPAVPKFDRCKFKLKGASTAEFTPIRQFLPELQPAAVVCYQCCKRGMVALMLHELPIDAKFPAYTEYQYEGRTYFMDEQLGYRTVCWKTRNEKIICTVVAKLPLPQLLEVAAEAREQLDK